MELRGAISILIAARIASTLGMPRRIVVGCDQGKPERAGEQNGCWAGSPIYDGVESGARCCACIQSAAACALRAAVKIARGSFFRV